MGREYISSAAWKEFEERFRDAASFLMEAELKGELAYLEKRNLNLPKSITPQLTARLWELRGWQDLQDQLYSIEKRLGAGIPFTLPVSVPTSGIVYYLQHDGALYRAMSLGRDGYYDGLSIYKYIWMTGPKQGQTESSYSQIFWRRPYDLGERRRIWGELTIFERNKYKYLFPEEEFQCETKSA